MKEALPDAFHSLNCRGKLIDLTEPKLMGILNLTPDSFSDGGKFSGEKSALKQVEKMVTEGAAFVDIGAQSTRPHAELLPAEEEIRRLGKVISKVKAEFPDVLVSLDTFWSETVRYGFEEGIDLVNDISAGQFDPKMSATVAGTGLPYVLMHVNSSHGAMHEKMHYEDVTYSVNRFLLQKAQELLEAGVKDIILDPGFGFGKTTEDQHQLLQEADFIGLGRYPVLIGISRKSFIYKPLGKSPSGITEEMQKLHRTVLEKGAKILRVHDVLEAKEAVDAFLSR